MRVLYKMSAQGNIENTSGKRIVANRLLYSLLAVVFSVLSFPCNSFATHSKFAYAATPVIKPSTGDTLSYNITYDLLHIIKDHLGSQRVVLNNSGNIRERNDYYPFGLRTDQGRAYPTFSDRYTVKVPRLTQGANGTITQTGYRATAPYTLQYNGKELQLLANTTLIDYGARQYNPTLARWTAQDPMAEKYYGISPYAYCVGNPINSIDYQGDTVIVYATKLPSNKKLYKIIWFPTHTFTVVKHSDGRMNKYAYGSETGGIFSGKLTQVNYSQDEQIMKADTDDQDFVKKRIIVEPPKGMTSEEFDKSVDEAAAKFGNNKNITYSILPMLPTQGNCNTSTFSLLHNAGVSNTQLNKIRQKIEGLTGDPGPIKPWTKKEQEETVDKVNAILSTIFQALLFLK